jgi:hypothetical protein
MSLPADINDYTKELVEEHLSGAFVKCDIEKQDQEGNYVSSVSHSGQGGY